MMINSVCLFTIIIMKPTKAVQIKARAFSPTLSMQIFWASFVMLWKNRNGLTWALSIGIVSIDSLIKDFYY